MTIAKSARAIAARVAATAAARLPAAPRSHERFPVETRRRGDRRVVAAPLLIVPLSMFALAGCTTLLSYDDLQPRGDATVDTVPDVTVDASDAPDPIEADTGPTLAHPPGRPPGDPTAAGTGTYWYAISHFYFGLNDASGALSTTAWRTIGFDLDDVCTSASDSSTSIGTCRRAATSPLAVLTDGDECRDNNFGSRVMGLVALANAAFETNANANIHDKGSSTWAMALDDVDPATDDPYVPGRLFRVVALPGSATPVWDGSDVRVVAADSLVGGSLATPIATFPNGYIRGNTWVSGEPVDRDIALPSGGSSLHFALKSVVIAVPLTSDRTKAAGATLVGALPIDKVEAVLRPIAGASSICPGSPLYVNALTQLLTYGDLVAGAPHLQDIAHDCDAISLGLNFDMQGIQPVTAVDSSSSPPVDKCSDAGVD